LAFNRIAYVSTACYTTRNDLLSNDANHFIPVKTEVEIGVPLQLSVCVDRAYLKLKTIVLKLTNILDSFIETGDSWKLNIQQQVRGIFDIRIRVKDQT